MNPLSEAAQQALGFVTSEAWGTTPYMDVRVYEDAARLRDVLQAALAQQDESVQEQAEPVPGAWVASPDGRVIYDDVSADDGLLRVSGDFENDEQRIRYAQRIVDKLNAAPPKDEPVQEPVAKCIDDICSEHLGRVEAFDHLPKGTLLYTIFPRRTMVPLTEEEIDALPWNGSPQQFARAVEKASWEKNHGQA